MSLGDTSWNHTGDWTFFAPVHREKTSPCAADCPVGEPIHQYMHLVTEGRYREAWEMIMAVNPLPAVCGRVCYHRCEIRCNRGEMDEPVNIHAVERFLGDLAVEEGWQVTGTGQELGGQPVTIVGSGPAGLACAYHLRLKGYPVAVLERESAPGGMLRLGVPGYRLPRPVLDAEIERLDKLGVEFRCGHKVESLEELTAGSRAVFLATGAHGSRDPGLEGLGSGEGREGVFFGLEFLRSFNNGAPPELGSRVAVVGGGNTAIDVARVCRRLGAKVELLYRRTEQEMPAHPEEVGQARREGVKFSFQVAPAGVVSGRGGKAGQGPAEGLRMLRMQQGEPDQSGRARPVPVEGSEFTVRAGSVVFAIGESPELDYLEGKGERQGERLVADPRGRTNIPGVFAGGDIVAGGEYTVTHALAAGRAAALGIHQALSGGETGEEKEEELEIVGYEQINTDYFWKAPRKEKPLSVKARPAGEGPELDETFSEKDAGIEAGRCFNCGTCINCDNCVIFCPDLAVSCDGEEYEVNRVYCKGCGICVQECPRAVITMERKS
ncbi:MAG: NAD(P)-binding protein [Gemmatimonadota bacterium]|nr:NAD(P)-binding protein [Gemmatimonadota bacterium]